MAHLLPMRNVVIRWRHSTDPIRYTNCTSNAIGDFQGVLYTATPKAEVRKIGSTKEIAGSYDPPGSAGIQNYYKDAYTYADWIKDVDIQDLYRIHKHVVGNFNLNGDGYNLIAADANHSNSITSTDVSVLKALLFGRILKLSAFEAPWRFVPEYIPQNYAVQFHANPFNMNFPTINGQNPAGTPYTESTWEYEMPADANKHGYDGIKIGDVFGDPSTPAACEAPATMSFSNVPLLAPNQNYDITFRVTGFTDVEAFQLGMFVDHTKLEVLNVSSSSLPEFGMENSVGIEQLENDQLNVLWFQSNTQPITLNSQTEFIKVRVKVLQPVADLGAAFNLEAILPNKFFRASGCTGASLSIQGLVAPLAGNRPISNRNLDEQARGVTLYCYPNPVGEQLNISFENSEAGQGLLQLADISGKILLSKSVEIVAGINTLSLSSIEMASLPEGVLFATLQTNIGTKSGRLVKL